MSTEYKPCIVCYKNKNDPCSHVSCPNRKPITAQVSDGSQPIIFTDNTGFRKIATKHGNES